MPATPTAAPAGDITTTFANTHPTPLPHAPPFPHPTPPLPHTTPHTPPPPPGRSQLGPAFGRTVSIDRRVWLTTHALRKWGDLYSIWEGEE